MHSKLCMKKRLQNNKKKSASSLFAVAPSPLLF